MGKLITILSSIYLVVIAFYFLWFEFLSYKIGIEKIANKIFKELKIKPIPIYFSMLYNNAYFSDKNNFPHLYFGLELLKRNERDWDGVFNYINFSFNSRHDKLFFIVAHEIGHYLQFCRHRAWYNCYGMEAKSKRRLCINAKNYRKIKLEKYADKLALGIYKRVNKKD